MRCLIVCESVHHGNTAKVAKALEKALHAEVRKPADVDAGTLAEYGLIGFGSGIYLARHHRALFEKVGGLDLRGRRVFIFSTAGFPLFKPVFHLELKARLLWKGARIVGEFTCPGHDTYGPYRLIGGLNKGRPNQEDLGRAKEFGRKIGGLG
jgi:flavodoxin